MVTTKVAVVAAAGACAAVALLARRRRPRGGGVRRARGGDLETIVRFTKALALETEACSLPDAGVRRAARRALARAPPLLGGFGGGLRPRYWLCESAATGAAVGFVLTSPAAVGDEAEAPLPSLRFVLTSPETSDWWGGEYWWVSSLFVDRAHRRAGVARALLRAVLADARAEGVQTVNLRVEAANASAQALYRSVGFEIDDSHFVMSCGRTPSGASVGAA